MAFKKILDSLHWVKTRSKAQGFSIDGESQNCYWVLFSIGPILNLEDTLVWSPGLSASDCKKKFFENRSGKWFVEFISIFVSVKRTWLKIKAFHAALPLSFFNFDNAFFQPSQVKILN